MDNVVLNLQAINGAVILSMDEYEKMKETIQELEMRLKDEQELNRINYSVLSELWELRMPGGPDQWDCKRIRQALEHAVSMIDGVKNVREVLGCGLRDAKLIVDIAMMLGVWSPVTGYKERKRP